MQGISCYCPMHTVIINAGSDRLNDLGEFTKFVLWAVNEKYSTHDISEAIELSELIVEDELAYLRQIGFVQEENRQPAVTETGLGYLELLTAINLFNTGRHSARLNFFSGDISDVNPLAMTAFPVDGYVFPEKVSKFIIQNRDYLPLQTYSKSKFEYIFSHLRPEFYESLYFYMFPDGKDTTVYQKYKASEIPALYQQFSNHGDTMLILERELLKYEFTYTDDRLLYYRTVLDTLEKLHLFDSTLLSDRAHILLQWKKNERMVNTGTAPLLFDGATGTQLEDFPPETQINSRNIPKLHLPSQECSYDDYVNILTDSGTVSYKRNLKCVNKKCFQQLIPFRCFEEEFS